MTTRADGVRHLYVHLPFCAHRCGYCDFVTLVGRPDQHARYVDALLGELALEGGVLSEPLETVFLGGGTPTFTEPEALRRLLGALPGASEVTIEANPETVTAELAKLLAESRITRVSLGVQSFQPGLLEVLERRAQPDDVRRAIYHLRDAQIDNISLDLIYGIPGQEPSHLERDLDEALALEPDHVSCYELEAKPGTRFTHRYGGELVRQGEAMEGYFERVVERLVTAGYRWYETANFCRPGRQSSHNLGYWLGRDYLGLGIGAVSTVAGLRWRNAPSLGGYLRALEDAQAPARELEPIDVDTHRRERLMLGLRLDEPIPFADVAGAVNEDALRRLERLGLAERRSGGLVLTRR
ncbi:MAG TPA: radical SAM family heme chaperone HemW, partial [Gaiellaceae bacterium]|nr:radical SAM family heme chaperone HemW [Gaiellaceae bacterium]